jgi:predicted restriction endonuclease
MRSFRELCDTVEYVEIDSGLMQLLLNPIENKRFVDEIYARFLNKQATPSEEQLELFRDQRAEAAYARLLLEPEEFVRKVVTKEKDSGEIYVHNADFKRLIFQIYNHRCAVTGRGVRYGSSTLLEAWQCVAVKSWYSYLIFFFISSARLVVNGKADALPVE